MKLDVEGGVALHLELRGTPVLEGVPLHRQCVTGDLVELAEESYIRGVLAGRLPQECRLLRAEVTPIWAPRPLVKEIEVTMTVEASGATRKHTQRFTSGRWVRTAEALRQTLVQEGTVREDATVYRALIGSPQPEAAAIEMPPVELPQVAEQSLEDYGVRRLGAGTLNPERPVLLGRRMVADILELTEKAELNEAGGAVLGKILRLKECLPGTSTPLVTVLSAAVGDARHVGGPASFRFSPEALAEAAEIARLRNQGEAILTAWHSHGWTAACGQCRKESCGLPNAGQVSADDYQVLESLFSSKATLMPIAGRSVGVQGPRPVIMVHHWSNGAMRPLRWQQYDD